jgi:hypothetical protein
VGWCAATSLVTESLVGGVAPVGVLEVCVPPVPTAMPGGALRTVESVDVDEFVFDLGTGIASLAGAEEALSVCLVPVAGPDLVLDGVPVEDVVLEEDAVWEESVVAEFVDEP